jgi:type I restriction enzyme S subunit
MSDELPQGWTPATLGEVCSKPQYGWTCSAAKDGRVKYLRTTDISDGQINWSTVPFCAETPDDIEKYRVRTDDIVVSRAGSVGVSHRIMNVPCDAVFASYLIRFNPLDGIEPKFVEAFLKSRDYWKEISDFTAGIAIPNVNASKLASLELPLAPLVEQRRIVAKLEKLLGQVDACQQRLAKIPGLLKRFRKAILAAACSGRLTARWREENERIEDAGALLNKMEAERRERCSVAGGKRKYREPEPVMDEDLPDIPETWRWTNFDHCAWEITVGHVGPMKERYSENGIAFLRCQNVRPLRFDSAGLVRIPPDFHKTLSKSKLVGGEILVVRSGANTGDCCVFPHEVGEANCADLVITRPLSGLNAKYGALYVNSPEGQARLILNQTGIAQPHFNIGAMRVKAFPLPPLSEQQEIVRRVENLFALAGRLEARFAEGQKRADSITQAILAKAFGGDLVPTEFELAKAEGRSFESAAELLKRIKGNGKLKQNPLKRARKIQA